MVDKVLADILSGFGVSRLEDLDEDDRRSLIADHQWWSPVGLVEVDGRVWTFAELNERWDRGFCVWDRAEVIDGYKAIHCPGDAVGETGEVIFRAESESVWWRVDISAEPGDPDGYCAGCGGSWMAHSSAEKAGCAADRPYEVWDPVNIFRNADVNGVDLTGGGRFIACPSTAAWAVNRWSVNVDIPSRNWDDVLRVSGIRVFCDTAGDWRQHNGHLLTGEEDLDDIELFITIEDRHTVLAEKIPAVVDCSWVAPRPAAGGTDWRRLAAEAEARGDFPEAWTISRSARLENSNFPQCPPEREFHTRAEIATTPWTAGITSEIVSRGGMPLLRDGERRAGIGAVERSIGGVGW